MTANAIMLRVSPFVAETISAPVERTKTAIQANSIIILKFLFIL